MGQNGNTIYREGKIIVEKTFFEKVCYDAGNNLITAQFDGRGGVSKYAVMNKFSVFSAFYSTYSVNGKPLGWDMDKRVEMIGRAQRVFFSVPEADFAVTYFLDGTTNAVFCEVEVSARERVEFRNVINFGINFSSYLEQLLANRLSVKNIRKIVGGLIRNRKPSLTVRDGVGYIRNDVMGDFYLDFAVGEGAEVLEKERNFYNQFAFGGMVDAGSKKSFRYVMSAGTRGDFTFCDVVEAFGRFDASYAESEAYVASFACPEGLDDFHRSFYNSLVNCSLSNYKELGDFKGFLAGIVYQFPARTYYRDSYWTVLSVLPVKPELVRNQIITLCKGVNYKTGECPSAVKFNFRNYWGNHYDSPSFLAFLKGEQEYDCTPWGNPTYSILGWQKPCYLINDGYCETFAELMDCIDKYSLGPKGTRPECKDCMLHSGYEASAVCDIFGSVSGLLRAWKHMRNFKKSV